MEDYLKQAMLDGMAKEAGWKGEGFKQLGKKALSAGGKALSSNMGKGVLSGLGFSAVSAPVGWAMFDAKKKEFEDSTTKMVSDARDPNSALGKEVQKTTQHFADKAPGLFGDGALNWLGSKYDKGADWLGGVVNTPEAGDWLKKNKGMTLGGGAGIGALLLYMALRQRSQRTQQPVIIQQPTAQPQAQPQAQQRRMPSWLRKR